MIRGVASSQIGADALTRDAGYDIVIIAGQSNAVNFSGTALGTNDSLDNFVDWDDSRIYQWSYDGGVKMVDGVPTLDSDYAMKLLKAHEPLRFPKLADETWSTRFGPNPGMNFARRRLLDIPSNRNIVLIPMAVPGVGLNNSYWQATSPVEGSLFTKTVQATTAALSALPNSRVTHILWIQGENESQTNPATTSPTQYQNALLDLIDQFRLQIPTAENAKFTIGSMVPEWIDLNAPINQAEDIDNVHRNIPRLRDNCWYIPGPLNSYFDEGGNPADNIHYNAAGGREHGKRMAAKAKAMDSIASAADLTVCTNINAVGVAVSWEVPTSDAPIYLVQYKDSGLVSAWNEVYFIPPYYVEPGDIVTYTFTNLSADVDVRVAPVYGSFVGPYSDIVTVDYVTIPQPYIELDFDNATAPSNVISSVPSIGTNTTAWTSVSGKEPLLQTIKGHRSMRTTVANSVLRGPGLPGGSYTAMFLVKHRSFSGTGAYFCDTDALTTYLCWRGGDNKIDMGHGGNGAAAVANTAMVLEQFYVVHLKFDSSIASNNLKIYINGVLDAQGSGTQSLPATTSTSINEVLNSANNGNDADFLAIKFWNSDLTDQQIAQDATIVPALKNITL